MEKLPALWAPKAAFGLTVVLLLSLSVVAGLLVRQAYEDELRAAEVRAETSAHVVAAHVRWIGEAAYLALRRVDDSLGHGIARITDAVGSNVDVALTSMPGEVPVRLVAADGSFVRTKNTEAIAANIADRPYFQALRNGDEWRISPMITDRFSEEKVFVISRRIERNGRFLGVALILVPADLLSAFWSSLDLGPGSAVSLIRDDGWLVARHPAPEASINLADRVLFTRYLPEAPAGSYRSSESPADGLSRIVGYHRVAGLPLIATAGISRDTALAHFWARVGPAALVAVPIALALLAMAIAVAVLLRRYERQRGRLTQALEQNRMLFLEMHHRVKNNLATVLSLLQMQPLPADSRRELSSRIRAMAALHEQIYLSDQFGAIDLSGYLRRMVDNLCQTKPDGVQVTCRLADVEVDADKALPLGLIINEVATNAFKHAFPDGRCGMLAITLERLGEDRARLHIRDDGVGFEGERPAGGMGSRLIGGLCRQIAADCVFRSEGGTVFTLDFPLASSPDGVASDPAPAGPTARPEAAG